MPKQVLKHKFRLPIGDWSDDGHGKCEWFTFHSNKKLQDVFDAYHNAKEKYPLVCPGLICEAYEDSEIDGPTRKTISEMGFDFKEPSPTEEEFAEFVLWFIQLGDSKLKLKMEKTIQLDKFINWNDENKDRYTDNFGYGLFV